ncbi:uncharacterized protein KY384_002676 [Bacidia gigantensis]|uniref:uncharacterized protein n=1 Tax=Bacidia gigantensis TaxID=2732470 RepID=UPI001D0542EC|nr:uncharacterized protein KY384_002676 [Bacidia gigantensis]KAG8532798.1 hypothetical protein KY384_002676 [Bacidia gigantensis]
MGVYIPSIDTHPNDERIFLGEDDEGRLLLRPNLTVDYGHHKKIGLTSAQCVSMALTEVCSQMKAGKVYDFGGNRTRQTKLTARLNNGFAHRQSVWGDWSPDRRRVDSNVRTDRLNYLNALGTGSRLRRDNIVMPIALEYNAVEMVGVYLLWFKVNLTSTQAHVKVGYQKLAISGRYAMLVVTPRVYVGWNDRFAEIAEAEGSIQITNLQKPCAAEAVLYLKRMFHEGHHEGLAFFADISEAISNAQEDGQGRNAGIKGKDRGAKVKGRSEKGGNVGKKRTGVSKRKSMSKPGEMQTTK